MSNQTNAGPGDYYYLSSTGVNQVYFNEDSSPPLGIIDKHVLYVMDDDILYYDGQQIATGSPSNPVVTGVSPTTLNGVPRWANTDGNSIKDSDVVISNNGDVQLTTDYSSLLFKDPSDTGPLPILSLNQTTGDFQQNLSVGFNNGTVVVDGGDTSNYGRNVCIGHTNLLQGLTGPPEFLQDNLIIGNDNLVSVSFDTYSNVCMGQEICKEGDITDEFSENVIIGSYALRTQDGGFVGENNIIGASALVENSSAYLANNVINGSYAVYKLNSDTNFQLNVVEGFACWNRLAGIDAGTYAGNIFIAPNGARRVSCASPGDHSNSNVGIGVYSFGESGTGGTINNCCAVGDRTFHDIGDGANANCAFGSLSGYVLTTGTKNTFYGYASGNGVTTQSDNTLIGANSMVNSAASSCTAVGRCNTSLATPHTFSNCLYLDINTNITSDESDVIRVGNAAHTKNFTAGVAGVTTVVNDAIPVLVSASTGQLGTVSSSKKYKKDIEPLTGSEVIYKMKPVSYRHTDHENTEKKSIGLLAEDVEKFYPDMCVYVPKIVTEEVIVEEDPVVEQMTEEDGSMSYILVPKSHVETKEHTEMELLTLDYTRLGILLLAEVQKLKLELETLKKIKISG